MCVAWSFFPNNMISRIMLSTDGVILGQAMSFIVRLQSIQIN